MKRKFFYLFFLFFLFSQQMFALTYAQKNYTTSFWDKIKGIASWIYYQYRMRGGSGDVVIPIKIYLGYGYDWALVYWQSGVADWTFKEGQNNRCGRIGYYNLTSLNVSGYIVKALPKVPQPYYGDCGGFFWNNISFLGVDLYTMTGTNLDVSTRVVVGSGVMKNPDDNNFYRFSLLAQSQNLYPIIRDASVVNLPVDQLIGKNFLNTQDFLDDVNRDNPHNINTIPYIPDTKDYFSRGYVDGRGNVIGSSSTYTIDESSYNVINDTVSFQGVQYSSYVYVVNEVTVTIKNNINIDVSTTNQKLQDIYDFLSSTSDVGVSYDVYYTSISYATNTISNVYDTIKTFFTSTSSDTWDCSLHFGSITFLNTSYDLGSVDLCEKWGWVFDLLRAMLKLSAFVMAYYILTEAL